MTMKHVPAPWSVNDNQDGTLYVVAPWSDKITTLNTNTFGSCHGSHICEVRYTEGGIPTKEQAIAHATMIAAAPDLLEALKELLGDFAQLIEYYNEERTADAWDAVTIDEMSNGAIKARAAIAKATGEEE